MKSVIVTGATSMIGVALIEECIKENVRVTAIVRKNSGRMSRLPESGLINIVEMELDELGCAALPDGREYDCFYHLAWGWTTKDVRDNPEFQLRNIGYTMDAVNLAGRCGCSKFIGAGSQAEYGMCDAVTAPDTPVQPVSSYGISKYAAGKLAAKLCGQLGITCLWGRIYSVYGENDNDGTMIRYAFEQFHKKETAYFSAGTQMWNYLHASDAGRMLYLMGDKCEKSAVYNIAHHESRTLKSYIEDIRRVLGEEFKYELKETSGAALLQLNPDTSDTCRDLDYHPRISFMEGISMLSETGFGRTSES